MLNMNQKRNIVEKIKSENALSGISLDVMEIVSNSEIAMTVGQIYIKYKQKYPRTSRSRNEIAKRVSDLMNWGAMKTVGSTKCPVSNRTSSTLTLTGNMPDKNKTLIKPTTLPFTRAIENEKSNIEVNTILHSLQRSGELITAAYAMINGLKFVSIILFFLPSVRNKINNATMKLDLAIKMIKDSENRLLIVNARSENKEAI